MLFFVDLIHSSLSLPIIITVSDFRVKLSQAISNRRDTTKNCVPLRGR